MTFLCSVLMYSIDHCNMKHRTSGCTSLSISDNLGQIAPGDRNGEILAGQSDTGTM